MCASQLLRGVRPVTLDTGARSRVMPTLSVAFAGVRKGSRMKIGIAHWFALAVAIAAVAVAVLVWDRYEARRIERAIAAGFSEIGAEAEKEQAALRASQRKMEERRIAADRAKRKREEAQRRELMRVAQAEARDRREGRYYREADDGMKVGTYACRNAQVVRRTADGWEVPLDGQGKPAKCRTDP